MTATTILALALPVGILFGAGQMLGRWIVWKHCEAFRDLAWRMFGRSR